MHASHCDSRNESDLHGKVKCINELLGLVSLSLDMRRDLLIHDCESFENLLTETNKASFNALYNFLNHYNTKYDSTSVI